MSSIDISSTNDVTSTAASDTNGSFATTANGAQAAAHMLTTDGIIRECIKQGFYRNPICNEKLYLHNRGYDSIAPTAFEPYTDVKVLWLEGNGLSVLPCGIGYTQVQPPVRTDPFAAAMAETETEPEDASSAAADAQTLGAAHPSQHVDPHGAALRHDASTSPSHTVASKPPVTLPLAADVPPEDRDAFSSLYPTVRQLYLHNNLFRVMPDLSRFEWLDSVNLSGNFFSSVEPHCVSYDAAVCRHRASGDAEGTCRSPPKSLQREREEQQQQQQQHQAGQGVRGDSTTTPASADMTVVLTSSTDAKRQRAAQLEQQRRTADVYSVFCEHSPMPEREEAPRPAAIGGAADAGAAQRPHPRQPLPPAPEHRNPCSCLRSLNLASNRLETFEDCLGLLCYRALAVLDLSHNHIADGEALLLILERLPRLQSLKLSGNPLVRTLTRYRKRVLSRCKGLLHLDDRPVFEEERRLVTAWSVGGDDGEEKERHAIHQERVAAEKKRLEDFRRLISRHQRAGEEGPHSDYVNAITTVTALSAAADTADAQSRQRRAGREGRARRQRQQRGRHTTSDPDSSPTSSDSEEEEEEGGEAEAAQASTPHRPFATATVTSTGAVRSMASPESDRIISPHENKPHNDVATALTQQRQQRVLSSNQHVAPIESASSAARGGNRGDNDDEEEEGDIFVPGAT